VRLSLRSPVPREWRLIHWFEHILFAAKRQGVRLVLCEHTEWENVPNDLIREIGDFDRNNEVITNR
jgi:hypothetical protein